MKIKITFTLAGLAILTLAGSPSNAALNFFSNQSQLNSAATVTGPANFDAYYTAAQANQGFLSNDGFLQGPEFDYSNAGPGGPTDVVFTSPNTDGLFIDGNDGNDFDASHLTPAFNTSVLDTFPHSDAGLSTINVAFSAPTTAFGTFFAEDGGGNTTITVYDALNPLGQVLTPVAAPDSAAPDAALFFGFTDTSDITKITFVGTPFPGVTGDLVLSNFSFGNAGGSTNPNNPTPEPSSLVVIAIMGLGLAGLAAKMRFSKTAQ
jgi:hypothetical protein